MECKFCKIILNEANRQPRYFRCKSCHTIKNKERLQIYYMDNHERLKEYNKKYNSDNKMNIKLYYQKYYQDRKDELQQKYRDVYRNKKLQMIPPRETPNFIVAL